MTDDDSIISIHIRERKTPWTYVDYLRCAAADGNDAIQIRPTWMSKRDFASQFGASSTTATTGFFTVVTNRAAFDRFLARALYLIHRDGVDYADDDAFDVESIFVDLLNYRSDSMGHDLVFYCWNTPTHPCLLIDDGESEEASEDASDSEDSVDEANGNDMCEKVKEAMIMEHYRTSRAFAAMKAASAQASKDYDAMTAEEKEEREKEWHAHQMQKEQWRAQDEARDAEWRLWEQRSCGVTHVRCNGRPVMGYVHDDGSYRCAAHDGRRPKKQT